MINRKVKNLFIIVSSIFLVLPLLTFAEIKNNIRCPTLTLTLSKGMTDGETGGQVTLLQQFLTTQNASSSQLTSGYFGDITEINLAKFQATHNIPISNSTEAITRAAIASYCKTASLSGVGSSTVQMEPSASFDQDYLTFLTSTPTLSGEASSTNGFIDLRIIKQDGTIPVYKNSTIPVVSGRWSIGIYPPISTGTYQAGLYVNNLQLASSTITIGLKSIPSIELGLLSPFDVVDGVLMRFRVYASNFGGIALNQFTFGLETDSIDVSQLSLKIFSDPLYSNMATSTFQDGLVNSYPVDPSNSLAVIVPDSPIEIDAGQSYYFELDGSVVPTDTSYSVKTTLLGDSEATSTMSVPVLAPSVNFLWSPNTYGTASTSDSDWLDGAPLSTLPRTGLSQVRTNAPDAPVCSVSTDLTLIIPNQPVNLTWSSSNTTYSLWSDGSQGSPSGSKVVTPSTTTTYLVNFFGPGGNISCFATVYVANPANVAPAPIIPPPPVNPPATTTPPVSTSTPPTSGTFTATPKTATVSSPVVFAGSVNTLHSCAAQKYTLGYGDSTSTSTIFVSANSCKAQTFNINHTYSKVGTFVAGLYLGTGTTAQKIQTQTITVKPRLAFIFQGTSNVANVLYSLETILSERAKNILNFFKFFHY